MKFRIHGASREDGTDQIIELDAATEAEAVRAAPTLLIERVEKVPMLEYRSAVKQERLPLETRSAGPTLPWISPTGVLGGLLIALGIIISVPGTFVAIQNASRYHPDRFDKGYAPGATANALERLEQPEWSAHECLSLGSLMILAGAACRGVAGIKRIEFRMEHDA